jgi:hypothetical protein
MLNEVNTVWPDKPFFYQINTWVWLNTLSQKYHQPITLDNVPDEALDEIESYQIDAVWLMGVWSRSPQGSRMARAYAHEYRSVLPDLTDEDIIGSAYAIWDYQVDPRLGGPEALADLRMRLQTRNLRLILDYVPNHVALDHPWVHQHPEYLIQGTPRDLANRPSDFYVAADLRGHKQIIAHGRDPYFPGWEDTAQVNAFNPEYRQVAADTLLNIAAQCDGVRCDMAMLLVNRIFAHTWQGYYNKKDVPQTEFWPDIIRQVKAAYPGFLFMAEVYWNMEFELQQQGFDYTYDKTLYDRLVGSPARDVRVHLIASIDYQKRLVRFIENHDEPRAYYRFGPPKSRAAGVIVSTLPGATLLHDGQLIGRSAKLPVQIRRQPDEPVDNALFMFYRRLLAEMRHSIYQKGTWRLFHPFPAWHGNHTYDNLVAYGWNQDEKDYRLIVVNLSNTQSQALVNLSPWHGIGGHDWLLDDRLNGHIYSRSGDSMVHPGLYIDLKPFEAHIFSFQQQS